MDFGEWAIEEMLKLYWTNHLYYNSLCVAASFKTLPRMTTLYASFFIQIQAFKYIAPLFVQVKIML